MREKTTAKALEVTEKRLSLPRILTPQKQQENEKTAKHNETESPAALAAAFGGGGVHKLHKAKRLRICGRRLLLYGDFSLL